ncbi:MAG: hypothetical protein AAFV85_16330 [Cyanobacteria bacterium J06634_6]
MKGFKVSTLISISAGLLTLTLPVFTQSAAIAFGQASPSTDSSYINHLYSFLESTDNLTYVMATESMTERDSIQAAQMFCNTFESGVDPADAFSAYTSTAIRQATAMGAEMTEEMAYAVGLYGGAVMNLGTAYYCPEYQSQVEQALQSFL